MNKVFSVKTAMVRGGVLVALVGSPLQAQVPATAFVGVNVIPMDRDTVLERQTVVVDSGRIVALGPVANVSVPKHATIVRADGQYLMPGLGDMHAHIGYPASHQRDTLNTFHHELLALVANGVTVIRDMHSGGQLGTRARTPTGDESWRLRLREQIAAGEILGPRLYTTGDPDESSPANAATSVEALKKSGHDFVKISFANDDESRSLYDSIVAAAARVGLPVVGHMPPIDGFKSVVHARQRSLEHLDRLPEHILGLGDYFIPGGKTIFHDAVSLVDTAFWMAPNFQLDKSVLRRTARTLERAGVWVCPTLIVFDALLSRPRDSSVSTRVRSPERAARDTAIMAIFRRYTEFLGPITKALSDAGVELILGTDMNFHGVVPGFSLPDELQLLVKAGLTPYQALATGTRNIAVFLRDAQNSGTIAIGKRADLVLLNGNPLRDINAVRGPAGVMLAGRYFSRKELDMRLDALPAPSPKMAEEQRTLYETVRNRRTQAWLPRVDANP